MESENWAFSFKVNIHMIYIIYTYNIIKDLIPVNVQYN